MEKRRGRGRAIHINVGSRITESKTPVNTAAGLTDNDCVGFEEPHASGDDVFGGELYLSGPMSCLSIPREDE